MNPLVVQKYMNWKVPIKLTFTRVRRTTNFYELN